MNVHNVMEEVVKVRVNDLYESFNETKPAWLTCSCENCKLDVISYVLNRLPPKYVVSGRGVTHSNNYMNNSQLKADINALALDGIRIISSTQRPFHTFPREECEVKSNSNPVFNFPTFIGAVYDGSTFEPVANAQILLKCNGETAQMVDRTWTNPAVTYQSTKGSYSFWVRALPSAEKGETKIFNFTIEVSAEGYETSIYNFELPVTSDSKLQEELNTTYSVKIKDMVIFKEEDTEE